ncbi:hypothetical protein Ancab_022915 [Ancistrocladus abbreviatus]
MASIGEAIATINGYDYIGDLGHGSMASMANVVARLLGSSPSGGCTAAMVWRRFGDHCVPQILLKLIHWWTQRIGEEVFFADARSLVGSTAWCGSTFHCSCICLGLGPHRIRVPP